MSVFGPSLATDAFTVNAGSSRLFGFELSAEAEPTDRFSLYGSVGYSNTEFTDFVFAGQQVAGNEFPFAPQWTAAVGFEYQWPSGFTWGVDASFTDDSFLGPDNRPGFEADSRFLVNTQVTYEQDGWLAGLYVRNLFDNDYVVSRTDSFTPEQVISGEPFTVGLFVERTF